MPDSLFFDGGIIAAAAARYFVILAYHTEPFCGMSPPCLCMLMSGACLHGMLPRPLSWLLCCTAKSVKPVSGESMASHQILFPYPFLTTSCPARLGRESAACLPLTLLMRRRACSLCSITDSYTEIIIHWNSLIPYENILSIIVVLFVGGVRDSKGFQLSLGRWYLRLLS